MNRPFQISPFPTVLATAVFAFLVTSSWGETAATKISPDQGPVLWGQTLLEMATPFRLMCVAAHPDDEDTETLAYYNRGYGVRTSIMLGTWGEGGQNEIGPELYEELGVIRSREMLEAARLHGSRVYCLNLVDFGYSKSPEEAWTFWDHEEALHRAVRILREERPHVVITNHRVGAGHGHHQAIAQLITEAIPLAASTEAYADQIQEGLSPWRVERLYERCQHHEGKPEEEYDLRIPVRKMNPARGVSYQDIASESLMRHRSQGAKGVWEMVNHHRRSMPFNHFRLIIGEPPLGPYDDLFDGMEGHWWDREGWQPFTYEGLIGATPTLRDKRRVGLETALEALRPDLKAAEEALNEALDAVKALPVELDEDPRWERDTPADIQQGKASWTPEEEAAYQRQVIDAMQVLGEEQRRLENLLAEIWGLKIEVQVSEKSPCPGQEFDLNVVVYNQGEEAVRTEGFLLDLPQGWKSGATMIEIGHLDPMGLASATYRIEVSTGEVPTVPETTDLYRSSQPWQPNIRASVAVSKNGVTACLETAKRLEISPAWEIWIAPERALVPADSSEELVFAVETRRNQPTPAECQLVVTLPGGETRETSIEGNHAQRSMTRVPWSAQEDLGEGTHFIEASLMTPSGTYEAQARIEILDLNVPENLHVGVVKSYDETLATVLRTLGVEVTLLEENDLKNGDLSGFDTILVDIRGYLEREDLRESNHRLLSYAAEGGHLVVFYHKSHEWNDASPPYAPYPLLLSRNRVTDENAPVTLLEPEHPLFRFPNKISAEDWDGWIQERGLYFPGQFDERYSCLVSMSDRGEPPLNGGILWAEVGQGTYVYTSLVFYRQLRAFVPGVYRVFTNLISYPVAEALR